jgi:hypothetical protein
MKTEPAQRIGALELRGQIGLLRDPAAHTCRGEGRVDDG